MPLPGPPAPLVAEPVLRLRAAAAVPRKFAPQRDAAAHGLALLAEHAGWAVLGLALMARLGVLARFVGSPHFGVQSGDMRFYHDWALRICAGEWTDHHAFYGLPGYAFLLAGIYRVVGVHPGAVLLLQALADSATAWLIFQITRRMLERSSPLPVKPWPPTALAALASLGWILFVPAQVFSAVLMPTVLAVACYWFCVAQAMHGESLVKPWRSLGLGALVGACAMMVATVLFALPLLIVAALRAKVSRAHRALALALLGLGVLLGSAPASLHNHLIAREPVFLSAHGGINFWIGNAPGANGYPKVPSPLRSGQQELLIDSISVAEQQSGGPLTRAEVSHYWSAKAWAHIHQEPGVWAQLLVQKMRNFWNAFVYDDVTIIALLREEEVLLPGLGFGFVASLGAAGLCLALAEKRRARWVAAAVLLQMLALLPVFVTERYRLAAVPGLLILSAYLLMRAVEFGQARRWRALASCAGLVALTTALVHLPVPPGLIASLEPYNLAISELEVGQLDRAEKHLLIAQALAPGNPSLLFALGNLALKRGDTTAARAYYHQTLERDPRQADAYTNLGVIAFGEKRWEVAARLLRVALSLEPGDPATTELLHRAERQGR